MKTSTLSAAAMIAVAGLTCGVANAQSLINISGATLFENFFSVPASTIDYIDADSNGQSRQNGFVQQLAPFNLPATPATKWLVDYRGVGSGNGVGELFTWGQSFNTSTGQSGALGQTSATLTSAYINRSKYYDGVLGLNGVANSTNPGAKPVTTNTTSPFALTTYTNPGTPSGGGVRVDLAIVDVPTAWFVQIAGTAAEGRTPGAAGYGRNAILAKNKNGTATTQANTLRSITQGAVTFNLYTTPASANANTIFDTPIASATIAVLANQGVGKTETTYSELRHLTTTGRSNTGENLVFVTRDSGSGTRNGFNNSIGIDPSWGVGENIGLRSTSAPLDLLGVDFLPTNKNGSGALERTVGFHRLAVGYAGAERGINVGSYLSSGKVEALAVKADTIGGTIARRPYIDYVLDNNANGYNIAGPETFASIGDPRNQNEVGGTPGNTNPRMANPAAAAYLNNITRSIDAFVGAPGGLVTEFTPGEFLSSNFILVAATDNIANPTNPSQLIPNPTFNQALQDYSRGASELGLPAWQNYGTVSLNGKVPTRTTGVTYSDGVALGANYIDMSNNALTFGTNLSNRNRVSGDFSGDGARNADDIAYAVRAFRHRNSGGAYTFTPPAGSGPIAGAPGSDLSIEIIGDFNGDGTFNRHDLRYMADGLAIATASNNSSLANIGKLDRKAGFVAIDTEWNALGVSSNFFGTTLKTGKPYAAGDSRGDVANSTGLQAPGWTPIGAEGPSDGTNTVPALDRNVIDAFDIDYVYKQFKTNPRVTDGALNWSNLSEAIGGDLSCDINGDLVIDQADITDLVVNILKTKMGDVNLDGVVNQADLDIANNVANFNLPGGWARGDINGDGIVNAADIAIITSNLGPCNPADICGVGATYDNGTVDVGPDRQLTIEDFLNFLSAFGDGTGCPGTSPCNPADICGVGATYNNGTVDVGPDGDLTIEDFLNFLSAFGDGTGCP